jgi:Peroxidase, family 2
MFVSALTEVYNVENSFANTLATQGIQSVPHAEAGPNALNLANLDKHDAIEHDASLTRHDAIQGDNHSVQPKLVEALLADASGQYLTVESLAKTRTRREAESRQVGSPALDAKHSTLAYGESALLLQVLGHLGGKGDGSEYLVPKSAARQWLLEERLPDGWKKPPYQITLASTTLLSGKIVAAKAVNAVGSAAGALLGAASGVASALSNAGAKSAQSAAPAYGARVH